MQVQSLHKQLLLSKWHLHFRCDEEVLLKTVLFEKEREKENNSFHVTMFTRENCVGGHIGPGLKPISCLDTCLLKYDKASKPDYAWIK